MVESVVEEVLEMDSSLDICRLCLTKDKDSLISIFHEKENKLQSKIENLLQTEVDPGDNWPKMICLECSDKLESFGHFFELSRSSESVLIHLFGPVEILPKNGRNFEEIEIVEIISMKNGPEEDFAEGGGTVYEDSEEEAIVEENSLELKEENQLEAIVEKGPEISTRKHKKSSEISDETIANFVTMQCEVCPEVSPTFNELKSHYEDHHEGMKMFVKCCDMKFTKRFYLAQHIQFHLNPDTFGCDFCDKKFDRKSKLTTHLEVHRSNEERRFKCLECNAVFTRKYGLEKHKEKHIPDKDRHFTCQYCRRSYAFQVTLRNHIKYVHKKDKSSHICDICAKVFKTKASLKLHLQNHSGIHIPRILCKICNRTVQAGSSFKKHMAIHNRDEDPKFECEICGKLAHSKHAIVSHKKVVHPDPRQLHDCELCGKEFKTAINFKEHMASHRGEMLYTCVYCPKQFNSNANRYSHQKKKHPIEWAKDRKNKLERF